MATKSVAALPKTDNVCAIEAYVPSLVQAAAKAANRHTASISSASGLMVGGVARKVDGTGRPASDRKAAGLCVRESCSAVNRWRN